MDKKQVVEVIEALKKHGNVREIYEVTRFEGCRKVRGGETHSIAIEIMDAGPQADSQMRYVCQLKTHDGQTKSSNPEETIEMAISMAHWMDLDS